jgi:hypothetical protein
MPTERAGVIVRDEIPPVRLEQPLSPADLERAKRIRWQWVLTYNQFRSMPMGVDRDVGLARCEEVVAIIDALIAAQPTTH